MTADSPGPFAFALYALAAMYVVTVAHELSHAAAGALAGLRITACGIGFRKLLFRFRLFGTVFYQTRSPFGGLTFWCPKAGLGSPKTQAVMIAAGPLSDLTIAVTALTLWLQGFTWPWMPPLLLVAGTFALLGLFPYSFTVRGMQLRNDMSLLIRLLRGRTYSIEETTQALRTHCMLRDFCREIGAWQQVILSTLGIAAAQASLEDVAGARETLGDEALSDPRRGELLLAFETIVRGVVAAAAREQSASAQLAEAIEIAREHPGLVVALRLAQVEIDACRGEPVTELLDQLSEEGLRTGNPQVVNVAQALRWQVEPPEDPVQAYETFADPRRRARPFPLLQLHVAKTMLAALCERGETEGARRLFQAALRLVRSIAARIPLETTRQHFLLRNTRELHEAVLKLDRADHVPLYVNAVVEEAPENTRARCFWIFVAGIAIGLAIGFAVCVAALLTD